MVSNKKGFTLIELLIVISIISLLSIIGLIAYSNFLKNSRDAKRQSDLKFIQSALEDYHADQHYYPSAALGSPFTNATGAPSGTVVSKTYLTTVPKDPKDQTAYLYVFKPATCDNSPTNPCTSYCLYAKIEGSAPTSDTVCTPSTPYTYGVTRP